MTARPARPTRPRGAEPAPAAPPRRRFALPARPLAGAVAEARAREAGIERAAMAGALLLGLTASGFAGYVIADQARPYAVQAVLPAETKPFAWKRPVVAARPVAPERDLDRTLDLDPTTTGAIPEPARGRARGQGTMQEPAQQGPAQAGADESGYSLRRVGGGVAELQGAAGSITVSTGSDLPGAGRVLAIRNTGAGWVVITTQTIIGPARL